MGVVIPIQTKGFYNPPMNRDSPVVSCHTHPNDGLLQRARTQRERVGSCHTHPNDGLLQPSIVVLTRRPCCHTHPNDGLLQQHFKTLSTRRSCHTHPNDGLLQQVWHKPWKSKTVSYIFQMTCSTKMPINRTFGASFGMDKLYCFLVLSH